MQQLIEKAAVLVEALPYIRRFRGRTVVVKYGGHAMDDDKTRESFAKDIVLLRYVGIHMVVVHGGGPQIAELLRRLGIQSRFVGGLRVTDDATMEVVEMVLAGTVNKEIVRQIAQAGGQAVGITGKDGGLVRARRLESELGRVGEVELVSPRLVEQLLASDFTPVIAPVGVDGAGETVNINADPFAGSIAAALGAEKLVLMTDVQGVRDREGNLVSTLTTDRARQWIADGTIHGGMIPKVECGLRAVERGVGKAHIIDGRVDHALLLEVFTDSGVGTELVAGT
jgi:acetylglutamate kinase